ncbi:hypothetical protein J1C48_04005 [Jiella sp. CQZ9-1]|uniref:Uncharacterized protein n=1 Tax=Jiella flava TaxID=2816857 RepID=A0A939JT38_9HYPH|nr:hypothetical protein [Jiella flava]
MIAGKMRVAEGVDEFACLKPADLGDHRRQQRIEDDGERLSDIVCFSLSGTIIPITN